ncbi:hypothetical protein B484DRAFT_327648 [Ochromonadaceae sp. CCMP2298]|nr:hypothetical protein B484DRAFT_327648 [Ochromonadaceae sp. CCMP2298]
MDSAKNFHDGRALWFSRDTSHKSLQLVHILYNWARLSRPTLNDQAHNDFLLSYPSNSVSGRESLSYDTFASVVERTASKFGFNPSNFGRHSLRIGGASLLRTAGASDMNICLMGRWKSLPACLGYQEVSTVTHDKTLNLLRTNAYTTRDIRLQYRIPELKTLASVAHELKFDQDIDSDDD